MPQTVNTFAPASGEIVSMWGDELKTTAVRLGASLTLTAGQAIAQNSSDQRWYAYDPTVIAVPAAAPTVAGNGAGSLYAAGTYVVDYTLETSYGQTLPSPSVAVTITANQNLRANALAGLSLAITRVNYFVNGVFAGFVVPAAGTAALIDLAGTAVAVANLRQRPLLNGALTAANGLGFARMILAKSCRTDAAGLATLGDQTPGEWGNGFSNVPAIFSGAFRRGDLGANVDANAITQLGLVLRTNSATAAEDVFRLP